jgi:peptidoglycan/xylan/chitin deacetylase (PgdA/CDA1 family)
MWTAKAIQEITGVFPKYMRAPTGAIDPRVRAVLKAMGMAIIAWDKVSDSHPYTETITVLASI